VIGPLGIGGLRTSRITLHDQPLAKPREFLGAETGPVEAGTVVRAAVHRSRMQLTEEDATAEKPREGRCERCFRGSYRFCGLEHHTHADLSEIRLDDLRNAVHLRVYGA